MFSADEEPTTADASSVALVRFIFRLPSFVPLPDGTVVSRRYPRPSGEPEEQTPFALVRLHQVELPFDTKLPADMQAADAALSRIEHSTPSGIGADHMPEVTTWHTVADVITARESPDEPEDGWDGQPQNQTSRQDALMRALDAARSVVRAVRLTEQSRVVLPTYERIPVMLLWMSATGVDDGAGVRVPNDSDWQVAGIMMLEHTNISGAEITDLQEQQSLLLQSRYWGYCLQAGSPAPLAREHLIEANRLLHHEGEYGRAVVAAATAVEVMTDSVLSALMWEEHRTEPGAVGLAQAAESFEEGRSAYRVVSALAPRLGGDWASPDSAFQRWRSAGSRLRNRIVHGGYAPSRAEAQEAIALADQLQRFLFDRVSAQANRYPRVTLMFVAQSGLETRGLYAGQIRRFNEEQAPVEDSWIDSFAAWHQRLLTA